MLFLFPLESLHRQLKWSELYGSNFMLCHVCICNNHTHIQYIPFFCVSYPTSLSMLLKNYRQPTKDYTSLLSLRLQD